MIAEPARLSQLSWAQTVSLLTATSELSHYFCRKADGHFLLTHPGYSTPQVPSFSLLTEASKVERAMHFLFTKNIFCIKSSVEYFHFTPVFSLPTAHGGPP